jgi:radical SAM superfamily enzyme YgiQ (UPF0313 family)
VQNFYPSPLANSTTMYYTGKNPLGKIGYKSEDVVVPKVINSAVCIKRCCVTTIRRTGR